MRQSKAALAGHTCGDCGREVWEHGRVPGGELVVCYVRGRYVAVNPTKPACSRWKPEKKEEEA